MFMFAVWITIYSCALKENKIKDNIIEYEKKEIKQQKSKIS